ncbi:hypothetical protein F5X68DRAFT_144294 [Plectosphaerella plurivora]|uniref:Uncharacterized protein n=1 Tax=Plectosphaerella plurivora TaxID=936078 RepID=A0A9P9A503_9PEZI|nr:hypothetical protein F5X68DRAFT_144294 [Plectosphaerella plurivora]
MATDKTIVLITGGNTGLGLEVVKALASSETAYEIIIGCRTPQKGEDAIATVKSELPNTRSSMSTVQVDYTSDPLIEEAIRSIDSKFGRLDILINNGGANYEHLQAAGKMTLREAWKATWDTNVVGTHILTTLATPLLLKSTNGRIIFIASGTSTLTETELFENPLQQRLNASPEKGWPKPPAHGPPVLGYRCSKTGMNMLMRDWHRTLLNDGVKVWAVSPGFLATNLGGVGVEVLKKMGAKDPAVGAALIRSVVDGEHDANAGKVIRADGVQPW